MEFIFKEASQKSVVLMMMYVDKFYEDNDSNLNMKKEDFVDGFKKIIQEMEDIDISFLNKKKYSKSKTTEKKSKKVKEIDEDDIDDDKCVYIFPRGANAKTQCEKSPEKHGYCKDHLKTKAVQKIIDEMDEDEEENEEEEKPKKGKKKSKKTDDEDEEEKPKKSKKSKSKKTEDEEEKPKSKSKKGKKSKKSNEEINEENEKENEEAEVDEE
jgi:hypothetical protein